MKPCDKYGDELPCRSGDQCEGVVWWEHRPFRDKERQKYKLHAMRVCPWIEQVREFWKKYRSRG